MGRTRGLLRICFFRPYGTGSSLFPLPRACALGCILSPLRGWVRSGPYTIGRSARKSPHLPEGDRWGGPAAFSGFVSFVPTGLGPPSSPYPGLAPWAAFLRRFAAAVAAERTRLGDRGKNPHVSRKERARSGAPGFDLGRVIRVSAHVGL